MKHYYLLFLGICMLISCSETEPVGGDTDPDGDNEHEVALEACFELSADTVEVGEELHLSNCSQGATSYSYDLGNGEQRTEANPVVSYEEGGEYDITLTVTNAKEETRTLTLTVLVQGTEPMEYFLYPDIEEGYSVIPLEAGIRPDNGEAYVIELREDLVGPGGSKFYYRSLDATYIATLHYIADKPFNSNSAFVNFLSNGNLNFHFSRTLAGLYGTQEITYTGAWAFLNGIFPANKHSYGFLSSGSNFLYYGTADDAGTYKAAIETRNASGDTFQIDLFDLGTSESMIADMIEVSGGYIALGGVFTQNDTEPRITGYKPVLAFFDSALNLTGQVVLNSSILDTKVSSPNDLNGSYHLAQMGNGNLVLYGNGELIVTDSSGNMISSTYYSNNGVVQALWASDTSFVISTDGSLRRFSADGNQVKEFNYPGKYLPEFVEKEGNLFFVAGYNTGDGVKLLYGAVDPQLNPLVLVQ